MKAKKDGQRRLANDWGLGKHCVGVNNRGWSTDRDGVRVVSFHNTAFHTYSLNDRVQHLFCAGQLIEAGLAKQGEVARGFKVSTRTLHRARQKMRDQGIAGLVPQKKGPQRRHKAGGAVGPRIVKLWQTGLGRLEIAARLGLREGTVRSVLKEKGLYPRLPIAQLPLPFEEANDEECAEDSNPGDLVLSPEPLHIHLHQLSAPGYTEAMMSLCAQLNAMNMAIPETNFRLRFHVKPRPETGQK